MVRVRLLSPPLMKVFLPLAKVSDSHIFAVGVDCGLVFPSSSLVPPLEVLSLIRAKELAEANLAKAAAKAAQAIEQERVDPATKSSVVQCNQPESAAAMLRELQRPADQPNVPKPKRIKAPSLLRERPIRRNTTARHARMNIPVSQ